MLNYCCKRRVEIKALTSLKENLFQVTLFIFHWNRREKVPNATLNVIDFIFQIVVGFRRLRGFYSTFVTFYHRPESSKSFLQR